jgi:lipid A 3-O-deacylase
MIPDAAQSQPPNIDTPVAEGKSIVRAAALMSAVLFMVAAAPAHAGDIFGGVYVHDVKLPTDKSGIEDGLDLQLGYRGDSIGHTPLQPYVFGALNTAGETSYAAVGLSAKFGHSIYIRPGLGIAIHDGSADKFFRTDKIAFGSRVLFEPELGIGAHINNRLSVEASWVHMSHGQLFGRENPGIDNLGLRLNLAL